MKKALWLSRHALTEEQLAGLKKITGDEVEIEQVDKTVKTAEEVANFGANCDYLAVVLVTLLADLYGLVGKTKTILVAKNKRVLMKNEDGTESKARFVYDGWEVIEEVKYKSHIVK